MILTHNGRSASFDPGTFAFAPLAPGANEEGNQQSPSEGSAPPYQASDDPLRRAALDLPVLQTPKPIEPTEWRRGRSLHRLVLNVANFCNLDCVYCYAKGGDYGGPKEKLATEIADRVFQRFYDLYETIHSVMFFGGEPLLNINLIERLCQEGWETADRLSRPRPVYTMISNGTVMSDRVIRLVKTYGIKMTISLDGPPEVNDRLRPYEMGAASTRTVERNIRALKAETGQPGQIEGTFTNLHAQLRISVCDVLDYVRTNLGVNSVHLPVNVLGSSSGGDAFAVQAEELDWVADCYAEAITKTIDSLVREPVSNVCLLNSALGLIELLMSPGPPAPFICPAGNGTIAVDSNGDVYPCFMFYRVGAYKLGSVLDSSNPIVDDESQYQFLGGLEPAKIPALSSSWASRFVNGCAGGNYFKSGHHNNMSENEISIVESMARAAVVELAHLRTNGDLWAFLPHALRLYKAYTALEEE